MWDFRFFEFLFRSKTEADPRDVFFGDGLFDLAEERNEELVAFRKTVTE